MIIIPAIDIMDHKVVQLVGGIPGSEKIVIPDPMKVAEDWISKGAEYLHIVDLDGAFGKENNLQIIKKIINEFNVPVEVGGGIKSEDVVEQLIDAGVDRVIVGTKAIKEPDWLAQLSNKFPNKIMLSMDTKGGAIAVKGWQSTSSISVSEMFEKVKELPLAGILNTNIDVEGQGKGIDVKFATDFINKSPHPVVASGGISSEKDAQALCKAGAIGAVVGIAVYTGLIKPWDWKTPWNV